MSTLTRCIYSSIASASFSESELPELLVKSRLANAAIDITGMLAYINGHFLQVIEGEENVVDRLFRKISEDPRHQRIYVLIREPIVSRSFAEWSMGFEALLPADMDALIGENDFFDGSSCVDSMDAGVVKTILTSFRQVRTSAP